MKFLSCGAGMQSSALCLQSVANKMIMDGRDVPYLYTPNVPIYDAVFFCDLGLEPEWVYTQVQFLKRACEDAGIPFYILRNSLYEDYLKSFGNSRVTSIPFWTVGEDGKKGRMLRNCTLDYKIQLIQSYIRTNILGYKKGEHTRAEDLKAHEMHIGFSFEERSRCKPNPHKMFTNIFPLVEMKLTRADNYSYILSTWGLDTKASACAFCPYHTNYFFSYLKEHNQQDYEKTVEFDTMLEEKQPISKIKSKLYISRSRKRSPSLMNMIAMISRHSLMERE